MKKQRLPFLKDHHNHLSFYAPLHQCLNLQQVKSKDEALRLLRQLDDRKVNVVLGWNSSFYRFEQHDLSGLPPALIVNLSLHQFLVSPAGEERLKPEFPEIMAHYRDPEWYESHMPQLLVFIANLVEITPECIRDFFDFLYDKGIYFIEDMLLSGGAFSRVFQSSPYTQRAAFWADGETYRGLDQQTRRGVKGVKLFTDGALGARTAALREPFLGGEKGVLLFSDEEFYRMMAETASLGTGVSVHAIGELAARQAVETVKKLRADGIGFPLVRMEHCQIIDESTARDAKELGIVLCMQPNFSTDSRDYTDRLPTHYLERNNPFRMLIDRIGFVPGEDLLFGSDGMPHGAEAALKTALFPPYPGQKLTLREFAAGYCITDETFKHGCLEVGIDETSRTLAMKQYAGTGTSRADSER